MTVSLGRVIAELAEPGQEIPTELVELLNRNVKPPSGLTAEDVFIRAMYIVSDQINSFGGRFPVEEHGRLAELMIDSPVLVGHRKDQLPVGRTFHAVTVEREGRPWVKSYFYWLKSSDRAEEFRANLDGGIYKECSIAFTFHLPECSICGKDVRRCQHQPFESYDRDGSAEPCHFNYRHIERVLETSLVYRGAVPDTAVAKDLSALQEGVSSPLDRLGDLDESVEYLILPRYDGLPVSVAMKDGYLSLTKEDGTVVLSEDGSNSVGFRSELMFSGILVGQRGKMRCSLSRLDDYLHGRTSPVTRLVLHLFPHLGLMIPPRLGARSRLEVRMLPHRIAGGERLEGAVREVLTRDGVEIRPLLRPGFASRTVAATCYLYRPSDGRCSLRPSPRITLVQGDGTGHLTIRVADASGRGAAASFAWDLLAFDMAGLRLGRRFVGRKAMASPDVTSSERRLEGGLRSIRREGEGLVFEAEGDFAGRFFIRPVRLKGEERYLFGRGSIVTDAGGER